MRARKFWKKVLTIKYLVALLIVLALGVVAIFYFAVGLDPVKLEIDNLEFTTEGFVDYSTKKKEELNNH